jgi:hypothetical protein
VPDPLPTIEVDRTELIARFLVQVKWFNLKTKHISPQAFSPKKPISPSTVFKTSVYRTQDCGDDEIWLIGENCVTKARKDGQRVLARADITADAILTAAALLIQPSPTPHARHADIVNWPDRREKQLDKMNILAELARLEPLPTASPT